jgi:HEAT repeat protein
LLIAIAAEFRDLIGPIPDIVIFLKDDDKDVRRAGINALSRLSGHGKKVKLSCLTLFISLLAKFHPLIEPAIPEIISLLDDNDESIRKAGIDALSKFSEHGKRVSLSPWHVVWLIDIVAKFRPLVKPATPVIIALLKDGDKGVRKAGADAVSKLLGQGK